MNMLTPVGQTKSGRDALANIIFVHGIGSSSETAWRSGESTEEGAFPDWLQDDLQRETGAPVNIWLMDYPAEIFRVIFRSVNRDDSIPQRSDTLRDGLLSQELTRRPVIFIAHSLGGILVKDMLRGSADMRPYGVGGGATSGKAYSLALSTRLVIFISTPHDGASIANIAMIVPELPQAALKYLLELVDWVPGSPLKRLAAPLMKRAIKHGPFLEALKRRDPHLEDLGAWYRHNAPQLGIMTKAYYENLPYKLSERLRVRTLTIVTRDSANPGVSGCECIPLEGDHASVCKPTHRQRDNYLRILGTVQDVLKHRCPAFAETHQAVLHVGQSFVALTELKRPERLAAVKNIVHPIEDRLGRPASELEYTWSPESGKPFKTENWQLHRAAESDYDIDRVILHVVCERREGLPTDEPEKYVRQETERLQVKLNQTKDVTLIPLHYAIRALQSVADRKQLQLSRYSAEQVERTRTLIERLATKEEPHEKMLRNLDALLRGALPSERPSRS